MINGCIWVENARANDFPLHDRTCKYIYATHRFLLHRIVKLAFSHESSPNSNNSGERYFMSAHNI